MLSPRKHPAEPIARENSRLSNNKGLSVEDSPYCLPWILNELSWVFDLTAFLVSYQDRSQLPETSIPSKRSVFTEDIIFLVPWQEEENIFVREELFRLDIDSYSDFALALSKK